jgi:hypothetical protein
VAFSLDKVVPWGRSFDEYLSMFDLTEQRLLEGRMLGCGDGPASFNAVLIERGGDVVSVDPIYRFSAAEVKSRIDATYLQIMEQARSNADEFIWRTIASVEQLGRIRAEAMAVFLADYPAGVDAGRYLSAALPVLPFSDRTFELALCSHLLFLYSEQLSAEFHCQSIKELCRVAKEVRVFPVLELGAVRSRHLESVMAHLRQEGYQTNLATVPYEFQKGGNQMLTVVRRPG